MIVSGYVAVLFGRSRTTEDVDVFIEELGWERFNKFWEAINKAGFECINAANAKEAFSEYLANNIAVRFALKHSFIPNVELKFARTKYNRYSLSKKLTVKMNSATINISELELQIAFKLKLGSQKDIEDARHLFKLFQKYLNRKLLLSYIREFRVEREAEVFLWSG